MPLEKYPRFIISSLFDSLYRVFFDVTLREILYLIRFFSFDKIIAYHNIQLNLPSDRACVGRKQCYGSHKLLTWYPNFDRDSEL